MARSSRDQGSPVNLFPMFNILMATLGIFVFILITIVVLTLGVGKTITLIPVVGPVQSFDKVPVYIEWNGYELMLHPTRERVTLDRNIKEISTWRETYEYLDNTLRGSSIETVLSEKKGGEERFFIILVRPDGFDNFRDLRGYFESKQLDIGYEPVEEGWSFRLR